MTDGNETKGRFLIVARMATNTNRGAKGAAITEGHHRVQTASLGPGDTGQKADLKPQGLFPAGRMGACRSPETAHGRASVVPCGASAIRAGKVKKAIQRNGLQRQRHKGMGGAVGIHIHQIKVLAAEKAIRQQTVGFPIRSPQQTMVLKDGKVLVEQRQPLWISIIGPQTPRLAFQPIPEGPHAATGHQIQDPRRAVRAQAAGKEHSQVPRWSGSRIEETLTGFKRGRSLTNEHAIWVHQAGTR
jgi:hypothetical protein